MLPPSFPMIRRMITAADFEPATFFAAALAVPENEMLEILDPAQCKRWREACDRKAGEPQQVREPGAGAIVKMTRTVKMRNADPKISSQHVRLFL